MPSSSPCPPRQPSQALSPAARHPRVVADPRFERRARSLHRSFPARPRRAMPRNGRKGEQEEGHRDAGLWSAALTRSWRVDREQAELELPRNQCTRAIRCTDFCAPFIGNGRAVDGSLGPGRAWAVSETSHRCHSSDTVIPPRSAPHYGDSRVSSCPPGEGGAPGDPRRRALFAIPYLQLDELARRGYRTVAVPGRLDS